MLINVQFEADRPGRGHMKHDDEIEIVRKLTNVRTYASAGVTTITAF